MGVVAAALRRRHPADDRVQGCPLCRWRRDWLFHLLGGAAEIAVVTVDDGPDGIAEIAQQAPAVRHLDRRRRPLMDPVGIGAGTVTRDDLDPGMLTKPRRQRLGLTVRQQVHDLVAFEVDEDSAVAMTSPPRPIIDTKHFRRWWRCLGDHGLGGHAQQRIGAGRNGEPLCQSSGGLTAERKSDVTLQIAEPGRPACRRGCNRPQPFSERLSGACGVQASKPPCRDPDRGRAPLPRQIAKHAGVIAMQAPRRQAAIRTAHCAPRETSLDGDSLSCRSHAADFERGGYYGQQWRRHEANHQGRESTVSSILHQSTRQSSTKSAREPNFGFSRTLRAVVPSRGVEDASTQQLEPGTAVHGSLQHFQAVHLSFHGARGPRQVERCLDGTDIAAEACGKLLQRPVGRVQNRAEAFRCFPAQQGVQPLRHGDRVGQRRECSSRWRTRLRSALGSTSGSAMTRCAKEQPDGTDVTWRLLIRDVFSRRAFAHCRTTPGRPVKPSSATSRQSELALWQPSAQRRSRWA